MQARLHFNPSSILTKNLAFNYSFDNHIDIISTYEIKEVENCINKVWQLSLNGYWCVGFVSFESTQAFDKFETKFKTSKTPLVYFAVYKKADYINNSFPYIKDKPKNFNLNIDLDINNYQQKFNHIQQMIRQGYVYQINYTNNITNATFKEINYYDLFYYLYNKQPHSYSAFLKYYINNEKYHMLSFSPELFFHYKHSENSILTQPMKGTAKRGSSKDEDEKIYQALINSEKEQAENIMIVDLLRNDLGKICKKSSIKTSNIFECIKLPTLWQMVSSIQGNLQDNCTLVDIFKALFPCGSITGAPKNQAINLINNYENEARNIYCGTIGIVMPNGDCIFNVAIRTLYTTMCNKQNYINYGLGSGITIDSKCCAEILELFAKSAFLK